MEWGRGEEGEVLFLLETHVSKGGVVRKGMRRRRKRMGKEGEEPEEGFLSYCQLRVPLIQM